MRKLLAACVVSLMASIPAPADTTDAVVGGGVRCALVNWRCWPVGEFTVEAREPDTGIVFSRGRFEDPVVVNLDCVYVVVDETGEGGRLRASGVDVTGDRWYLKVNQGDTTDPYVSLDQHWPQDGPCGTIPDGGPIARSGFNFGRFVFVEG